jgi:drug/metabolite transporter (DMT)-like permease
LTSGRVWGFLLGFAGVLLLIGPEALLAIGGDRGPLLPMLAVLAGALCYGVSAILARLRPSSDALTSAADVTSLAALFSLPSVLDSLVQGPSASTITLAMIASVLFLGLLSTATAMIVYFRLIQSAGPGFTSQLNYLIPLWAVAIGILFLGEAPTLGHLGGLSLILAGIVLARRGPIQP